MTDRRMWSITVKYARQRDGQVRFSSVHWSPPKDDWPIEVQIGVETLKRDMAHALYDHQDRLAVTTHTTPKDADA